MLTEERSGVPPQEELSIVNVTLPKAEVRDGVAFYIVNVTGSFNSWSVNKRYSQFEEMHNELAADFAFRNKTLPKGAALPPKEFKLLQSHLSSTFIERRRILLENYLKKLISSKETSKNATLLRFLTTDKHEYFEVPEERKTTSTSADTDDDVEVTSVTIPATRTMSDHVLYQIDVCNSKKRKSFSKWTVLKRFGQFFEMDSMLRQAFIEDLEFLEQLPPPPERKPKLLNDHMDPSFIEQRRALLEAYLQKLVVIPRVVRHAVFLQFVGVNV